MDHIALKSVFNSVFCMFMFCSLCYHFSIFVCVAARQTVFKVKGLGTDGVTVVPVFGYVPPNDTAIIRVRATTRNNNLKN